MEMKPKIPKTGKIGSLAKNIEKETNRDVVEKVMQDVDQLSQRLIVLNKQNGLKVLSSDWNKRLVKKKASKSWKNVVVNVVVQNIANMQSN